MFLYTEERQSLTTRRIVVGNPISPLKSCQDKPVGREGIRTPLNWSINSSTCWFSWTVHRSLSIGKANEDLAIPININRINQHGYHPSKSQRPNSHIYTFTSIYIYIYIYIIFAHLRETCIYENQSLLAFVETTLGSPAALIRWL